MDRLLNRRFAALHPTTFVTYRREADETPSKAWPISPHVALTPPARGDFRVRHAGVSTLRALARGAYSAAAMWAFNVSWSGAVSDSLTLAFEEEAEAAAWHAAFAKAIAAASEHRRSLSVASDRSELPATPTAAGDGSRAGSFAADGGVSAAAAAGAGAAAAAPPPDDGPRGRSWASVLHINGVAVYVEERDARGEGGALMVSAVVRAPPEEVHAALCAVRRREGLGLFSGARTLEAVDAHTHVVAQSWAAGGLLGALCAPREAVLLRTWRRDDDGTFVVLYQSTNHRAARPAPAGWWHWKAPVRARLQAAGFTIAPLLPRFAPAAGGSPESLVTLVLKADLGGALAERGALARLLPPAAAAGVRALLEPVVASVVVLRDGVEQSRFAVRPLSMAAGGEDGGAAARRREAFAAAGRTTTMLVYRGAPALADAQRAASPPPPPAPGAPPPGASAPAPGGAPAPPPPGAPPAEDESWAVGGTCPREFWLSPGACGFRVRGASYLADRKKVAAHPPMFELVAVDLLELEEHLPAVCRLLPSVRASPAPFLFCVQLMVPCSPPVAMVFSWAAPMPVFGVPAAELIAQFEERQGPCPDHVAAFFRAFVEFVEGEGPEADARRNRSFKLIPTLSQGSWVIKQAVGTTPVLLGQKLTTRYHRGANFFEVDVDLSSSSVASSITNLVAGATRSLALDMGVLVEGQSSAHLPEQLLGTVRLDHMDLRRTAYLDEATGRVVPGDELRSRAASRR